MYTLGHDSSVPPPPAVASTVERNWAVAAHVGGVVAGALTSLTAGVAAPVVAFCIWLYVRGRQPFAEVHARESTNFHLTMFVALLLLKVFVIGTLFIGALFVWPLFIAIALVWLWCTVHGAIRAWHGQAYRYPFTVRLLR